MRLGEDGDNHCERRGGNTPHGVGEQDINPAAAKAETDTPFIDPRLDAAGQRYRKTVTGRPRQRDHRRSASCQATIPTRVGMLRSVQARAAQYGERSVDSDGAHSSRRGDRRRCCMGE